MTNWKLMAGSCTRTRPARWSRSMRWVVTVPRLLPARRAPRHRCRRCTCPRTTPSEAEAKRLLAGAGIAAAPEAACATVEQAVAAAERFGFPVVMKILSPDIVHKSEIGGVLLDVTDADAVRAGFALVAASARRPRRLPRGSRACWSQSNSRAASSASSAFTAIRYLDPSRCSASAESSSRCMKDVVFHRCPFGADVAEAMIRSIKGAPLLLGARGRKTVDIPALAEMLSRLSAFAAAAGERLLSIDLNPVLAMPEGQGAFAVDAVIEVAPATAAE